MTTVTMEPIPKTSRDNASSPDSPSPLLDHYLSLQYRIELIEDEGAWVASNPDLPGCASFGSDPVDAVRNLAEVRRLWLEGQIASGNKIPEPSIDERYSGKFVLRIPKSLHRLAEMRARREGVSLNALVTNVLAGALNFGRDFEPAAHEIEHMHRNPWRLSHWRNEKNDQWSDEEARVAWHELSGKGVTVFINNVANQLATCHKSPFNPNQGEDYHAEEKRLARK
jgi:predicted RNase H-like HicB family nuclease